MTYSVTELHLDELLHESNGRLLLCPDTTLHHPQIGISGVGRES